MAINSNGDIYVTDYGNHRIQKFSPDGTHLQTYGIGILNNPHGFTIDLNDNIG